MADEEPKSELVAKHRGGGSYSVMKGDEEIVPSLTKDEAEAFNAKTDAKKFDFVEEHKAKTKDEEVKDPDGNPPSNEVPPTGEAAAPEDQQFEGATEHDPEIIGEKYKNARMLAVVLRLPKNLRRGKLMDTVKDMRAFVESFEEESDQDIASFLLQQLAEAHPNDIPSGAYRNDISKAIKALNGQEETAFDPVAERRARAAAANRLAQATARHKNPDQKQTANSPADGGAPVLDGDADQNQAAGRLYGG